MLKETKVKHYEEPALKTKQNKWDREYINSILINYLEMRALMV